MRLLNTPPLERSSRAPEHEAQWRQGGGGGGGGRRPGPSTPPPSCSAAPPPASTSPTISPPDARTTALSLDQIQAAAARHADEQPAESSAAASDGEVATENHGLDESIINFMGMDSSADFPSLYEDFFFGFPAEAEPPPQEHDVVGVDRHDGNEVFDEFPALWSF
ncbi:hypothetical protein OPV22_023809 [Ensete ventricosum]|uniref:Uncharacterized protein n=1 Tax=Ensete ventricosum TaxID=4639 RepID=A0AAV8QWE4_ENSVE|nr:hypothetical protein OPV22_023809 [Ensete ventricosum]